MSRGLRQKEKLRLGEVPRWAPGGPGAVMGGPSLRLGPWWEEGFATYLACGGPQCPLGRWVSRGVGTPRRGGGQALGQPHSL